MMNSTVRQPVPTLDPNSALHVALGQLAEAYAFALDQKKATPWRFAVEMERLLALGVSPNLLRWLWHKGYVARADEVTTPRDRTRKFRPCHNLVSAQRVCFILTDAGALFAASVLGRSMGCLVPGAARGEQAKIGASTAPRWDGQRRLLCVGRQVVKGFRLPSPNQEAVLAAFQEEGWPQRIDDPLPPKAEQDPKCRLHDTIKRLNRHQQYPLLQFSGDGTGEGVCWRYADRAPLVLPLSAGEIGETRRAA